MAIVPLLDPASRESEPFQFNRIYDGDCRNILPLIPKESVACSIWSPPYFVGKQYEIYLKTFDDWKSLLRETIRLHFDVIKPGGFLAINIADILCFYDPSMPKIQAENPDGRRSKVTREDVLRAIDEHPSFSRYELAALLGCSEQTIDRRLNGNNIRGGKHSTQTRVKLVGGLIEEWSSAAGFYLYDRRVWVKDAAWANSNWTTLSYRSVDEFEYVFIFWKPGVTTVRRSKLTSREWADWGSRGVWNIPSVRANDNHEAKFPIELPRRLISLLTDEGDVVLDPFVGSGTTAEAAISTHRNFIGIELSPLYADLARRRVQAAISRPRQMAFLVQ